MSVVCGAWSKIASFLAMKRFWDGRTASTINYVWARRLLGQTCTGLAMVDSPLDKLIFSYRWQLCRFSAWSYRFSEESLESQEWKLRGSRVVASITSSDHGWVEFTKQSQRLPRVSQCKKRKDISLSAIPEKRELVILRGRYPSTKSEGLSVLVLNFKRPPPYLTCWCTYNHHLHSAKII